MQDKLRKISKVEILCLLLTIMALTHLIISGDLVIVGVEFFIIIIVYWLYVLRRK